MAEGLIASVLNWLRAGYPEGVPPKDSFPLLALLRRTLSDDDYVKIVAELIAEEKKKVRVRHIRDAIERFTREEPAEADIRQVAAQLASGGWPLSGKAMRLADKVDEPLELGVPSADEAREGWAQAASEDVVEPVRPSIVERVVDWLRIGYPEGVPSNDYVPVLALLRRRLTDDEVTRVAEKLVEIADADREVEMEDAQAIMGKVLDGIPDEADMDRVLEHLRANGVTIAE
ncbi:hypothetical protein GCM10010922_04400 [Microbacterium sorbitolivorans]|nr:DUF3349 domain-containing protein [Microbacterium sorbitolivorans]GGF32415.1 hypothetical protein GCM10010922_04400 [Microbacterium sorbitolivorans]